MPFFCLSSMPADGFDILVNDCFAHNGANKRIQLIDHHGCPVDDKLISKFQGTWGMDGQMYQTIIYAHMKTFRCQDMQSLTLVTALILSILQPLGSPELPPSTSSVTSACAMGDAQ